MQRLKTRRKCLLALTVLLTTVAGAATKVHVIVFGKSTSVQWVPGLGADDKPLAIKVRPLIVDGRVKEYAVGAPHEVNGTAVCGAASISGE